MARSFTLLSLFIFILFSCSDDISQWRGPERDGIYPDKGLLTSWPEDGPSLKLSIEDIGKGFSQAVVYNDVIYVTGLKYDSLDVLSAFDVKGNKLWEKVYSRGWTGSYPDSRATPTIEKNKVYLIGGQAELICLNAKNGEIIWKQNPHKDFNGNYMHWGISESVLLTDDAALYLTGGDETTLVAYDKNTGKFKWKTESLGGRKPYASSSLIEWNKIKIALLQTSNDLIGVDVGNGKVLWSYNTIQYHVEKGKGEAANTPLFKDGDIFITYGNNQPGLMFSISEKGDSIHLKWRNNILDTHHGGLVLLDGYIYGSTMVHNTKGNWACVDWETGETKWEKEWLTKGSVISADGMIYLLEERGGNVALVKPDPDDMIISSSFKVPFGKGPHWAHPSIYKGMLFIRHGNFLMVYDIKEG